MSGAKLTFPSRARVIGQTPARTLHKFAESGPALAGMRALAEHEEAPPIAEAPTGLLPRDAMQVPLAPMPPPPTLTDAMLLEAARDASQHFYIPRYRLGTERASGVTHYNARIHLDGEDWLFTVHLDHYPAPELGAAAAGAQPLDGLPRVNLQYHTPVKEGLTRRSLDAEEVVRVDSGLRATFRFSGLSDQVGFYEALNNPDRAASLTVERRLQVGVPYMVEIQRLQRELSLLTGCPVVGINSEAVLMSWTTLAHNVYHLSAPPERGGKPSTQAVPCDRFGDPGPLPAPRESFMFIVENLDGRGMPTQGQHYRLRLLGGELALALSGGQLSIAPVEEPPGPAQRFWARDLRNGFQYLGLYNDLAEEWSFPKVVPAAPPFPGEPAYVKFSEVPPETLEGWVAPRKQRLEELMRRPLYEVTSLELPDTATPAPLYLPDKLHPYVYGSIAQKQPGRYGLVRVQLDGHAYYQDEGLPQRFFYLPDRYELAPREDPPGLPRMSIRATQDPDCYEVAYVAQPVVDAARLERDAARGLLEAANNLASRSVDVSDLELAPLLGDEVRFTLMLPTASEWRPRERPTPLPDLNHELQDQVQVNADGLRSLFDALFTTNAALFRGTFTVKLGTGPQGAWAVEHVPFEGTVASQDRQAVWDALFDPTVPASFAREVEVSLEPGLLAGEDRVEVLIENGGLVTLTAAQPKQVARLRPPISDFVLQKPDAGEFRYRLTRIRGEERRPGDWTVGQGNTLHLRSL